MIFLCSAQAMGAEDTLRSLQQDVLLAKEKTVEISGQMDSVNDALDDAKAHLVERESSQLVKTVDESGGASTPPAVPVKKIPQVYKPTFREQTEAAPPVRVPPAIPAVDEESPLAALDITPAPKQTLGRSIKEKFLNLPHIFSPKKGQEKDKPLPYAPPQTITDGDALYKVAVSDNKLTLSESIEVALANNVQLKALKMNVEVADAKLTEAKRGLFPTVQIFRDINGGKVTQTATSRFYKGDGQGVNMTQPVYYGGELTNTVKQAEENVMVAKTEHKKSRNDFIHQVRVAYFGVVKAEYNAQYQIELFEKLSDILKRLKDERELKLLPEIDYLNVESQYYQVLYQVEASKNDVLSANVTLKQSMNLEFEEPVPVDLRMDFMKFRPEFKELLARAMESNADIRIKVYQLQAARYGIDIYESKKKPHFELRGSYGSTGETFRDDIANEDDKDELDTEKQWYLGVHGSMPLGTSSVEYEQIKHVYGPTVLSLTGSEDWKHHVAFNLFDKFSAITDEKTAEYALLQAESDYQAAKNEITLRLRDDYYSLKKFLIQIDSSIAKLRYQEKQSAILEYMLTIQETMPSNYVENLVGKAQDKYAFIQAVADYNVALSSISTLIGDPDYFENQPLLQKLKPRDKDADAVQRAASAEI